VKRHPLDMSALLFGLAFAIAGGAVIVSQATDSTMNGHWVAAMGLILLGLVALSGTLLRNRPEATFEAAVDPVVDGTVDAEVSPEEPAS
jgi:hypothetical protein